MSERKTRKYPMRRIYTLDGVEIKSSECDGFLHKAKKDFDEDDRCPECNGLILLGQEYMLYGHYLDSPKWHKNCWLGPKVGNTILGVATSKIQKYGTKRTVVICKKFDSKGKEITGAKN